MLKVSFSLIFLIFIKKPVALDCFKFDDMAIIRNGPNGGLTGKFGSVIGYKLNGQDVIKGLAKVRTKKPGAKELANRAKFALLQAWQRPLLGVLRVGFRNYAPTFQGFVAAKSYNSKHALKTREDGTSYIDPSLALVSFGSLTVPKTMHMERQGDSILFTWSTDGHYEMIDQAMVLAYCSETGQAAYDIAAGKRYMGTASIELPDDSAGCEFHVYIAFVAYDHSSQSNSHYLGSVIA